MTNIISLTLPALSSRETSCSRDSKRYRRPPSRWRRVSSKLGETVIKTKHATCSPCTPVQVVTAQKIWDDDIFRRAIFRFGWPREMSSPPRPDREGIRAHNRQTSDRRLYLREVGAQVGPGAFSWCCGKPQTHRDAAAALPRGRKNERAQEATRNNRKEEDDASGDEEKGVYLDRGNKGIIGLCVRMKKTVGINN